jgi:hypothetical protein
LIPTNGSYWQLLQLLATQPLQLLAPLPILLLAAPLSPPLLKPNTERTRLTSSVRQLGQATGSVERNTRVSNWQSQLSQKYS